MKPSNDKAFAIFSRLLAIHIATKTVCTPFHKDTEIAYELAFDISHGIREMRQDIELDEPSEVEEVAGEAYDLVESLKTYLSEEIKTNKDPGMDNLLRSLYERTNSVCGTLRGYKVEAEEEKQEEEEIEKPKMGISPKILKMKQVHFTHAPGDYVETKFGTKGMVDRIAFDGDSCIYTVWHDKGEYISYSENKLKKTKKVKIGFTFHE